MNYKDQRVSIGREAAIALGNTMWWEKVTEREAAVRQMFTVEMCMPFDAFHRCITVALGRPVFTHEFGFDWNGLAAELMGERPAPTMTEIIDLIPAEKRIICGVR